MAPAATAKATKNPLAEGLAFFRGNTITLLAPASPGGVQDVTARVIAPYLESYLHATINIEDNGNAGSYEGQDDAASAAPTGLFLGMTNTIADLGAEWAGLLGLNFNPCTPTSSARAGRRSLSGSPIPRLRTRAGQL